MSAPELSPDKFVLLLPPDSDTATVREVQSALGVKLTSSEELGGQVRARDVLSSNSGLLYKNLQVAIVENVAEDQLRSAAGQAGLPLYWEKERLFRATQELALLADLRLALSMVTEQVDALEAQLRAREREREEQEDERVTWGLRSVGVAGSAYRGQGISVAVLDSGLFMEHPDFAGREIRGRSFVPRADWSLDGSGHGTHCAGIIAGGKSGENGIRYGVAPEVDLLIGKVLDDAGNGTTGGILDGIDWALEKGARVISLSLGAPVAIGARPSPIFERVGEQALAQNCLIVAAAGNESERPRQMPRPVNAPADAESILAVAALNRQLRVAPFSNAGINAGSGGRIDLAAPGVNVYSTYSRNAG
ncbi:MAG: S8 family serine peptidase, partial [Bacteroidota bacterium]